MDKMKFYGAPKSVRPKADSGKLCALYNCITCDLNIHEIHEIHEFLSLQTFHFDQSWF